VKLKLRLIVFAFLALGLEASAASKVTLVIYVDLSESMGRHRKMVSEMAGWLTEELKTKCGDYEVLVNNITYVAKHVPGGEVIKGYQEPDWITKDTPDGKEMVRRRIEYNSLNPAFHYMTMLHSGSREKTYTSVLETIEARLATSPGGPYQDTTVGVLILSDAAPVFEAFSPEEATTLLSQQVNGRNVMVGALGARRPSCMDTAYSENTSLADPPQPDLSKINWLNEFAALNRGYNWDICAPTIEGEASLLEQSVKDYMIMLMEEAQCLVMM
jgi:hypothetical protein